MKCLRCETEMVAYPNVKVAAELDMFECPECGYVETKMNNEKKGTKMVIG